MNLTFLTQFVDANKLGGWVRAGVASGLGFLLAHYAAQYPLLSDVLSPQVQASIGVGLATVVVGLWSQLTKTTEAKVAMVNDLAKDPTTEVQGVVLTNTDAGKALAAKIEGPVEVAGTPAATEIAKA